MESETLYCNPVYLMVLSGTGTNNRPNYKKPLDDCYQVLMPTTL
jgi:hypothetical protein